MDCYCKRWGSLERTETRFPPLWHGLLTVPLPPTEGLPDDARASPLRETFGQGEWHGQETVPQRG